MRFALAAAAALVAAYVPLAARAACECGYVDPATQAVWTDATIVYFNETGMDQIVIPATSPKGIYGSLLPGDTGTGQQAFTVIDNVVNPWEQDFGATYRSAFSANTTYADANTPSSGLAMQVSPANLETHIVNGSQIVTRRRDIQYGSFRAMIQHANTSGFGGAFKFGVSYNQSETVDMGIFLGDKPENSTLRWSFSAAGADADPIKNNLTYVNEDPRRVNLTYLSTDNTPIEHRIDWLSKKVVQFRNNGQNATTQFLAYEKGVNASNIPTSPAPVSLQTYANGEPSQSAGPPLFEPLVTRVLYVRFFYNSTLNARNEEFATSCKATNAASAVCSTEDWTLRNSTAFTTESLLRIKPIKEHFTPPIWAIAPSAFFCAMFIAIVIHGMIINAGKKKLRKADEAAHNESYEPSDAASIRSGRSGTKPGMLRPFGLNGGTEGTSRYLANVQAARQEESQDMPELYHDWEDSGSEYDSDDFDDAEVIHGDITPQHPRLSRVRRLSSMFIRRKSSVVPPGNANAAAKKKDRRSVRLSMLGRTQEEKDEGEGEAIELTSPMPTLSRFDSYRFGGPSLNDRGEGSSTGGSPPWAKDGKPLPSDADAEAMARAAEANARWRETAHPTIVNWKRRADSQAVGQLAQPINHNPAAHRMSIVPVQHSLFYMMYQRARGMVFIQAAGTTSTGERRIDYLDGMRGFACLGVSVGHFLLMFYHGVADGNVETMHYPAMEHWIRVIIGPIYFNAGMLLGIFFFLPARTMCLRYLLKGGLDTMADGTIRRLPRLMLPVLGACLANYMMIDIDGYKWVNRLASRTWSNWAYYQNYENVMAFVNAYITLWWAAPPDSPALVTGYATGVLWTIPVIVQGVWTCLTCALVAREIKKAWKRFTFYAICIFISWYVVSWDMFFMAGLVIADLDSVIDYRKWSNIGIPLIVLPYRLKGVYIAWAAFLGCCVQQWFMYIPGAPGGDMNMREYGYHPNLYTDKQHHDTAADMVYHYQDPRVFSWLWVVTMFVLADLSPAFQTIWRLRVWAWLGKHSMAFFLCHGVVFWTWGAWLCLTMLNNGAPYWAATLVTFVTSYIWLVFFAICFTATFEYWAVLFSKACWRAASGGYGRRV